MKQKYFILYAVSFFTMSTCFAQDSSRVPGNKDLRNKADTTLNASDQNDAAGNHDKEKPHAEINPNKGTIVPSTTSGGLNAAANPNTQFVIPFHKKRKAKPATSPAAEVVTPKE